MPGWVVDALTGAAVLFVLLLLIAVSVGIVLYRRHRSNLKRAGHISTSMRTYNYNYNTVNWDKDMNLKQ